MKTTTKIFFISMLFSAAVPSVLFSAEREEGVTFINENKEFELTNRNREGRGEGKFTTELITYQGIPEEFGIIITRSDSGEESFKRLGKCEFIEELNCRLALAALHSDEENCRKLLDANANPNGKNEDDTTALEIAYKKSVFDPNLSGEMLAVLQLLQQANASQEQR